jgi:hypothetical protein
VQIVLADVIAELEPLLEAPDCVLDWQAAGKDGAR